MSRWKECESDVFLFAPIRKETARIFARTKRRALRVVSSIENHILEKTVRIKFLPAARQSQESHEQLPSLRPLEVALVESACADPDFEDHVFLSISVVVCAKSGLLTESSAYFLCNQFSHVPPPTAQSCIEQTEFDKLIQDCLPAIFPHQREIARQCAVREQLGLCTGTDQKRHMVNSKLYNPILLGMTSGDDGADNGTDEGVFDRVPPSPYRGSLSIVEASTGSGKTLCALSVVKFQGSRFARLERPAYPAIDLGFNWIANPSVQHDKHLTTVKPRLALPRGGTLIICPVNLINHWESEIQKWCPEFTVSIFHGPNRGRKSLEALAASDIVLSSTSLCSRALQAANDLHISSPVRIQLQRLPEPNEDAFRQDWFRTLDLIHGMFRVVVATLVPGQCTPLVTGVLPSGLEQRTCSLWFPIHASDPIVWNDYIYVPRQDFGTHCHAFKVQFCASCSNDVVRVLPSVGRLWIPTLPTGDTAAQTLVFKVRSLVSSSQSTSVPLRLADISTDTNLACTNAALLRIQWSRLILDEIHLNQSPTGSLPRFLAMVRRDSTIALTASTGPTMLRSISKTLQTPFCDVMHSITRSHETPSESVVSAPLETIEYPIEHDIAEQTNHVLNTMYFNQLGMPRRGMIIMKSIQLARRGLRTGNFDTETMLELVRVWSEEDQEARGPGDVSVDRVVGDLMCCICFASSEDDVGWACLFPCKHALCLECWDVLRRRSSNRRLPCPLCRTPVREWKRVVIHSRPNPDQSTHSSQENNLFQESSSPPFGALCSIIQTALDKEERVIVFVELKCKATCIDLQTVFPSSTISCITGNMTLPQKSRVLESPSHVLIMPYRIGNVGLNLISFNHVVLYHLPGRYDMVQQAIGRVKRVGQEKPVRMHVPFVRNSIDARLWNGWKTDRALTPKDVVLTL